MLSLPLLLIALAPADPPDVHWPLWPSAVARDAEPLTHGAPGAIADNRRLAALRALDRYPTALIADLVVQALADPSPQIRREALQRCAARQIPACGSAARQIWRDPTGDLSNRLYALRVLAAEGSAESVQILLAALRLPMEVLRAEAIHLLATTPLPADSAPEIRASLVAKLADSAPEVRRAAARGLGLLGAREGALVLARMLEDPDPQVRRDAAEALGMIADPRTLPALVRTLDRGDEAHVARAFLRAYARFPGPEVDTHLLELLDAPPRGIMARQVAHDLGLRPQVSAAAIDGLVLRLREEGLRPHALDALFLLGEQALPALRAALERGLEPPIAVEIERILRASALDALTAPPPPPLPDPDDRLGWHTRLAGDTPLTAAAALAEHAPPWLAAATAGALARGGDAWRPWALAFALAAPAEVPGDLLLWPPLALRAADPGLAPADRCIALAALAPAHPRALAELGDPLAAALADPSPHVRACAALALPLGPAADAPLAALLHDPAPRVRSAAALALAARPAPAPRVRAAAEAARRAHRDARPPAARLRWIQAPLRTPGWLPLHLGDAVVEVPAHRAPPAADGLPTAWALVPATAPLVLAPAQGLPFEPEDEAVD